MMKIIKSCIWVLLFYFVVTSKPAYSQKASIIRDSIFSEVLSEKRQVKIYIPDDYVPGSDAKYDVVYILDGDTHFDDFLYIYKFAQKQQFIPPLILIALQNNYNSDGNTRNRDFIPDKKTSDVKKSGSDNFIAFFKTELMPYINKKLPVSGNNTLFGHSLGGLFTMYTLIKEPNLFDSYFCSDPTFSWNSRYIISLAEDKYRRSLELNKSLWLVGVEETYRNVGIARMDTVLQELAPMGLHWKTAIYPNESHMSVVLKGIYDGLKYFYNGYNAKKMVEFHPNNGSLLDGKPAPIFLNGSFPDVRYTVDGSEPDMSSKQAPQMIEITAPAKVTTKWVGENRKYTTASYGNFELSKVWPALQNVNNIKRGGLSYTYYEGKWDKLPEFNKLKPKKTGIADNQFSLGNLPSHSNFACVFEGYIKIDIEGYYNFAIRSSDGSKFFLNGREIINNDGRHNSDWYKSYVVPLQKGFYPVRLEYFLNEGIGHLDIIYIPLTTLETVNLKFDMMYYK